MEQRRFFRREGWQHQAKNAAALSGLLYFVPLASYPVLPVGMLLLMAIAENPLDTWPYVAGLFGWNVVVWAAWLLFLRSTRWLRFTATGPLAIALTLGPLYWGRTPSSEEIAEKRPPEHGIWEEVCTLQDFKISDKTSVSALDSGELWLYRAAAFFA